MAIYSCSIKSISRSNKGGGGGGRSIIASVAYADGEKLTNLWTGEVYDYTKKQGVESSAIYLPDDAPKWAMERETLWNAVEKAEKRKNSCLGRQIIVAIPHELSKPQRTELVGNMARFIAQRYNVAVDAAIHTPSRQGDERNFHAHILFSSRRINAQGFGEKTRELDDKRTSREEVQYLREMWATEANKALEKANVQARIDHRSLRAQGIKRMPGVHLGPTATEMERRDVRSRRGDMDRAVKAVNAQASAIEREIGQLARFQAERQKQVEQAKREGEIFNRLVECHKKCVRYATERLNNIVMLQKREKEENALWYYPDEPKGILANRKSVLKSKINRAEFLSTHIYKWQDVLLEKASHISVDSANPQKMEENKLALSLLHKKYPTMTPEKAGEILLKRKSRFDKYIYTFKKLERMNFISEKNPFSAVIKYSEMERKILEDEKRIREENKRIEQERREKEEREERLKIKERIEAPRRIEKLKDEDLKDYKETYKSFFNKLYSENVEWREANNILENNIEDKIKESINDTQRLLNSIEDKIISHNYEVDHLNWYQKIFKVSYYNNRIDKLESEYSNAEKNKKELKFQLENAKKEREHAENVKEKMENLFLNSPEYKAYSQRKEARNIEITRLDKLLEPVRERQRELERQRREKERQERERQRKIERSQGWSR